MIMNNLSGTTKSEMTFGSESKGVHATIKFEADSFRVLNKDGSLAYLHTAQGTDSDAAVTMGYLDAQLKRIEASQDKITSSDEVNMVHYNNESGTLGVNNITADRITGLQKNRVLITDENSAVTTSTVAKAQLLKLPNVPDDTQAELDKKADVDHSHTIADIEGLSGVLDSKALVDHTHKADEIEGVENLSVHHADYSDLADAAKTDPNGTPIADYVRNISISDNKITVAKGNGEISVTPYVDVLTPATSDADGKAGLVPAPCRADSGKFLSATGTWEKPVMDLNDSGITLTPEQVNGIPEDIQDVSDKVTALETSANQKISDLSDKMDESVDSLQKGIDSKADAEHTHSIDDVDSLSETLGNLNSLINENGKDLGNLSALVDTKANAEHTHEIEDITGLQDELDEKALQDHTHTIDQITDLSDAVVAEANKAVRDQNGKILTDYVTSVVADGSNLKVTHGDGSYTTVSVSAEGTYSEFTGATETEKGTFGLVPAPNAGDQNKVLSGAGTWIDAPAADLTASGIEATSEELNYMKGVTAPVQTQLDEKASTVHTHTAEEITDFDTAAKEAVSDELGEKADAVHTHVMADITDLADALGEKADATHTHTMSDITDLDLSTATVAEADKATADKNGKDITEYISGVEKTPENKIKVTKGDGTSSEIDLPESVTYDEFTGASAEAEGATGLVPAPAMGDQDKFLKADGTWAVPVDNDTTYDVATEDTAGLVKASAEIGVADDGSMSVVSIPQSKVVDLENDFAKMSQASNKFEIVGGTFEDTLVSYRPDEIRVAYSTLTPWTQQEEAEDPNKYYMTLRAYAPDGATGYRAAVGDSITDGEVQAFGAADEMGRNYVESLLPVATYDEGDSAWTYLGASQSSGKFVGWYYTVEWYNASNKMIGTSTVRINLASEATFNQVTPGYMADYSKTDHTHTASQITDLQSSVESIVTTTLETASVASAEEATKATQDKNGKDITEYVSDVTLEDSSLKIAKGDGSSSTIELPEGTAYADFTGTTGDTAGKAGLVPAPQTTDANKYLKSDGTWAAIDIPDAPTDVAVATEETAGIVKASSEIAVSGDGTMSITAVSQDKVTGLSDALAGKADTAHTHAISDVTDLQTTLDGKASADHTHTVSEITDLDLENATVAQATKATQDANGKALTEYVADVTEEENKIKVTKGDGSSSEITLPESVEYKNFAGATAEAEGASGLVPAPAMGDQDKFLKADGTWAVPVDNDTTYDVATTDTAGLVKASAEINVGADGAMSINSIAQSKVEGLETSLAEKANAEHGHTLEDITDITVDAEQLNALPEAVAGKAEASHTHEAADITDLSDTIDAKLTDVVRTSDLTSAKVAEADKVSNAVTVTFNGAPDSGVTFDGSEAKTLDITPAKVGAAEAEHTHEIADVTDLQTTLDGKAASVHTHTSADVTDLQDKLDEKANATHTHAISDVTDLQTTLDTKLEEDDLPIATDEATGMVKGSSEIHVAVDGEMTVTAIDQSKVTGLSDALAGKANSTHTHTVSEITDLDLSSASVASAEEATKATQDSNGKAITDYVADVTSEDNRIKVTKGDGSSSEITLPEGSIYSEFTGTTGTEAGKAGLVPAPQTTDANKFLKADGTWAEVTVDDATVDVATEEKAGIVKPSSEISVGVDGTMTVNEISQDKVTGLADALESKVDTTDFATADVAGIVKGSTEITVGGDGTMTIGEISQDKISNLTTDLASKASAVHTHTASQITDLADATVGTANKVSNAMTVTLNGGDGEGASVTFDGSAAQSMDITAAKIGAAEADHNHEISDITDLETTLAGKADSVHTHSTSDVTGLDTALAGKADASHTHAISEINDLQSTLDGKAASVHSHEITEVNGLQDALNAKLNSADLKVATSEDAGIVKGSDEITIGGDGTLTVNTIAQSKVDGLTDALGNKADSEHTHTMSDITDLDLSTANVAEATKATTDKNDKDITEYVSDVTLSDSKLKIAKGDGSSSEITLPEGAAYSDFTGASADAAGNAGLVPAPAQNDQDKFLKADGTWASIEIPEPEEVAVATNDTTGVVKGSTEINVGEDGSLSVTAIEQNKITGLSDALAGKADSTHEHTISQISDIADASVASATKATQDANGKALTEYISAVESTEDNKIKVTKGDGTSSEISLPESVTYDGFTGASAEAEGATGLVPAPAMGDQEKFLKADGTWAVPTDTNTTYDIATQETAGLVKPSTEIAVNSETGEMTVSAIDQSKVTGLTDALNEKAAASHTHSASEITDLADATVKAASQDSEGNTLSSYVKDLSIEGNKITATKGDSSKIEVDLPASEAGVSDPFTGTTGDSDGKAGLVPAPTTADADKFLASDGTWKVVQGASGEVSIKYVSQVPSTAAVGGISEGYVAPSGGIDILDLIYKLLHPYVAPTITATMVPRNGGTVGVATTQNVTAVRVNLQKANGNKIMSYQVYDVDSNFDSSIPLGELYADDYENGFAEGAQNVTLNSPYQITNASSHKYLTVRALDLDGNETVAKTASFTFVETYYWGTIPNGTLLTAEYIQNDSNKTSQASAKGTKVATFNLTDECVYFCAPKSYGEIKTVKDQNGFDNTSGFPMTELTINDREYYVYSLDGATTGEFTFTFSY